MGLFTAALWAVPLVLLRLVFFTDGQYHTAFIAVFGWCIALNAVTLIINLLDKCLAAGDFFDNPAVRIPELMLYFFTLLGGTPATALAMIFFCHKSSKKEYQGVFICISLFSILFIGGAFALAYGLEWHDMNKSVISTTIPFTNSTSLRTATTVTTNFNQSTTAEVMTTMASNSSILVPNITTTKGFDMSTITARQNFSTQALLPFVSSTDFGSTSDERSSTQGVTFA